MATVYGIGNALLDLEYRVSDAFLTEQGIDKGLMTLIDEARHDQILAALSEHSPCAITSGGSCVNSMALLHQLGTDAKVAVRVSADAAGDQYVNELDEVGVYHCLNSHPRPKGITGKCIVLVTPDAQRTMLSYLGVTQDFAPEDLDLAQIKSADYLYIEGYLVASPSANQAIEQAVAAAKSCGVRCALSLSDPSMIEFFRAQMSTVLDFGMDLLFCNEIEALSFAQCDSLEAARDKILTLAPLVVITRGPQGAWVCTSKSCDVVPAQVVKAIDTLGAGDMFAGGFIHAILQGQSHKEAGELANRLAAQVVTQHGPRLSKSDVDRLRQSTIGQV